MSYVSPTPVRRRTFESENNKQHQDTEQKVRYHDYSGLSHDSTPLSPLISGLFTQITIFVFPSIFAAAMEGTSAIDFIVTGGAQNVVI